MGLGKKKILSQGGAAVPVGTDNFNTVLYTGTGSSQAITGVGFAPDFIWIKDRDAANWHNLQNTIRGATKHLYSNATNAEDTTSDGLTSFDSDGFTIGGGGGFGNSGNDFVAWCWYAPTSETNNAGSNGATITSTIKKNKAAGFSIVKYTGNGTAGATIGHGLTSLTPSLIIWKNMSATSNWLVYSPLIGNDSQFLYLNLDVAFQTSGSANEYPTNKVNPTSSVVTVNGAGSSNNINISGEDTIMYCFADIAGYQKIGSYTGTNNTSGPIVTIGFEPSFLLIKGTQSTTQWLMIDNKRSTSNPRNKALFANLADAEGTNNSINFTSTTFQPITTDGDSNRAETYIYLAIA